jgi:hypothetical protein
MTNDTRRVVQAAQLLGIHGSSAATAPLLERLATSSAEWRGRAADLVPRGPSASWSPESVENNLVNALFQNRRFDLTKTDVARIRTLCVTDQCRSEADRHVRNE